MKILHVIWTFLNGGVETMLINVANEQIKLGHDVSILIVNNEIDCNLLNALNKNVNVIAINRNKGSKNILPLLKLNYKYLRLKPDITHFHFYNISDLFLLKNKSKWICTLHTTIIKENFYRHKIDSYIAISKIVKEKIEHIKKDINVTLCYNGIDFNKIKVKKQFNNEIKRIVCVGRLEFNLKGQDTIIDAFKLLSNYNYNIELDVIGDGSDFQKLNYLISENNLNKQIKVLGNQPNSIVLNSLDKYDAFIQASRHEGFGLTVVEAIASCLPTIISSVDGHIEISDNGELTNLFEVNNPENLFFKIKQLNDNYEKEVKKSYYRREVVIEKYSVKRMVENLNIEYKRNLMN